MELLILPRVDCIRRAGGIQLGAIERKRATILIAAAAALPAVSIALWSIGAAIRDLADPCTTWDAPPGMAVHIAAGDPCRSRSAHGESRAHRAALTAAFPGSMLGAAILAIAAAARGWPRAMFGAGMWMLAAALASFSVAMPLLILPGVAFLLLTGRVQKPS